MSIILANINLGSGVGVGDGDKLYTAFTKINQNFANIISNVNSLSNSVTSVAGRTGNVTLTTQDIIGMNNYLSLLNIAVPTTSTSPGTLGQMVVSGTTLYLCTAANTWVKTSVVASF